MSLPWTGGHKYGRNTFVSNPTTSNSDYGNWFGRTNNNMAPSISSNPVSIPNFRRAGLTRKVSDVTASRKYHFLNSSDNAHAHAQTVGDKNGNTAQDIHVPKSSKDGYTTESQHIQVIDLTSGNTRHHNGLHLGSNHRYSPEEYGGRYTELNTSQNGHKDTNLENLDKIYGSMNDLTFRTPARTSPQAQLTTNENIFGFDRSHTNLGSHVSSAPVSYEGGAGLRSSLQRSRSFTNGDHSYNYKSNPELWNSLSPRTRSRNRGSKYLFLSTPDSNTAQGVYTLETQSSMADYSPALGPRSRTSTGEMSTSHPYTTDIKSTEPYLYQSVSSASPELDTTRRPLSGSKQGSLTGSGSVLYPESDSLNERQRVTSANLDLNSSTNSFRSFPTGTDKKARKSILKKRSASLDRQTRTYDVRGRDINSIHLYGGNTWHGNHYGANLPPLSAIMDVPKKTSAKRVTFAV